MLCIAHAICHVSCYGNSTCYVSCYGNMTLFLAASRGPLMSAQFSGLSYGHVVEGAFNSPGTARRDDVALNVSTLAPHGLLLWRGEVCPYRLH